MATSLIWTEMLRERYSYYRYKVKRPLRKSLAYCFSKPLGTGFFAKICLLWQVWVMVRSILKYPDPAKENTKKRMSHLLIDMFDEFFAKDTNAGRKELLWNMRRVLISTVEHDTFESQRLTWGLLWLLTKYLNGEWPPLEDWCPDQCWNDPETLKALEIARKEFQTKLTIYGRPISEIET